MGGNQKLKYQSQFKKDVCVIMVVVIHQTVVMQYCSKFGLGDFLTVATVN